MTDNIKIEDWASVSIGKTHGVEEEGCAIGDDNAKKNRNYPVHSLAPDVEENDRAEGDESQWPVGRGTADCDRSKSDTDADYHRAGDYRREIMHDPFYADGLDDSSQQEIKHAGNEYAAAGVGKLLAVGHAGENA